MGARRIFCRGGQSWPGELRYKMSFKNCSLHNYRTLSQYIFMILLQWDEQNLSTISNYRFIAYNNINVYTHSKSYSTYNWLTVAYQERHVFFPGHRKIQRQNLASLLKYFPHVQDTGWMIKHVLFLFLFISYYVWFSYGNYFKHYSI